MVCSTCVGLNPDSCDAAVFLVATAQPSPAQLSFTQLNSPNALYSVEVCRTSPQSVPSRIRKYSSPTLFNGNRLLSCSRPTPLANAFMLAPMYALALES